MTLRQQSSEKKAQPSPVRISVLLGDIERGHIKIPTFQRHEIWTNEQVVELLDSIRRGFPIGSFLLWQTDQTLISERQIGGFHLPQTPDGMPRQYVLDGQQRITTLYATLSRLPQELPERYQLQYHLLEKEFIPYTPEQPESVVPMSVLFEPSSYGKLMAQFQQSRDSERLTNELNTLYETFRNYELAVVVTDAPALEDVAIIFERINRSGTHLTLFDLMVAATWGQDQGEFDLRQETESILEDLAENQFDELDKTTVLRSMSTIENGSARRASIEALRNESKADLRLLIQRTKDAMKRAVDFLGTSIQVHSVAMLPYERQFVAITHFMANNRRLTASHHDALRRWFWRTSFSERYRRGGEAQFDEDMVYLGQAPEDPNRLERFGSPPNADFFINTEFRKASAAAKAYAALMACQNPVNLTNGVAIDVGTALSTFNSREFHHIFPKRVLKDANTEDGLINSLSNICMLAASENKALGSQKPSVYLAGIRDEFGDEEFQLRLRSSLISEEAVVAALDDDYATFIQVRSKDLAQAVSEIV